MSNSLSKSLQGLLQPEHGYGLLDRLNGEVCRASCKVLFV